jgi:putative exporter of polyketide antibiotics
LHFETVEFEIAGWHADEHGKTRSGRIKKSVQIRFFRVHPRAIYTHQNPGKNLYLRSTTSTKTMRTHHKIIIVIICFILALIGFLIKIPVPLRGNDKLLHTVFYFGAAAFLHILFGRGLIFILIGLALFGVMIEYLQPLCNKFFHTKVHGRFDKEDIYANLKGLAIYTAIAVVFLTMRYLMHKNRDETVV